MYGYTLVNGTDVQSANNEPAVLQSQLQPILGPTVTVQNRGVGGSTCAQWLYGTGNPSITQSWAAEMAQSTAQIVAMNCGINDAYQPGLSTSDWNYMYSQFAAIANQYGKTFVVMTPNPINNPHNANFWSLVNDEKYVARQLGCPDR
ncbi:hypothetical protein [Paraburkholderia sp. RL17-347-BIC-D]|uniref:hypothetical protein n=1 Tax=Paraburkholderia sp. RL17-347-BIC-D TaxID=3031632 RepID=UPI0038B8E6B2